MKRRVLGLVLLAASLSFLGLAMAKTYHRLPRNTFHVRPSFAIAAVAFAALGNTVTAFVWRSVLHARRVELPASEAIRITSLSQLGKYLPGGFWQPLGQLGMARDAGIGTGVASVSIAMVMILVVAAALTVGPVLLLASRSAGLFGWLILGVPFALAALHPRVLDRVLALAARLSKREGVNVGGIPFGRVMRGLGLAIPVWFAHGLSLTFTALALRIGHGGDWVILSGAFAVAWAIGFLAIPVPGGLGIRETVLLLLLRPAFGTPRALAIAIMSRLFFIVAEAAMAGVSLAIPKRSVPAVKD